MLNISWCLCILPFANKGPGQSFSNWNLVAVFQLAMIEGHLLFWLSAGLPSLPVLDDVEEWAGMLQHWCRGRA